jgi:hypothetical protein
MSEEDALQNTFNMHLRRNVIFTYLGIQYNAALNLTLKHLSSLKGNIDTIDDSKFFAIENYLKTEGYFDYETN